MSIPRSLDGESSLSRSWRRGLAARPVWPLMISVGCAAALRGLTLLLLLTSVAFCVPALAADDSAAAQRARIARERAAVEREAQAAQAACAEQFAVTACVDRVKADRRERLRQLDHERALLDDELRKRRASERAAQIEQRQAELGQQPASTPARTRPPAADVAPKSPMPSAAAKAAANEAAAAQSEADAAERAAASARRASEAEAHRIAVEKRNRDRAAQRTPSPPLPQPPQAPASR
jgi:colicin import membrane protein